MEPLPDTIVTQIELPAPPPTAEPLDIPGNAPVSAAGHESDAVFLREGSIPAGTPGNAAPGHRPATIYHEQPASAPAQQGTPTLHSVPAANPPPVTRSQPAQYIDPYSPTIIYDDDQPAIPRRQSVVEVPRGPDPGALLKAGQFGVVEEIAESTRDAGLASSLGWAYYRARRNDRAYHWFERALQWNEDLYEAAYGLALTLFRQGQYERAEEVARWRLAQYPRMRSILNDIETRRAVSSFQSKQYTTSLNRLLAIQKHRRLTREEQIMLAWNRFHLGQVEEARRDFVRLYEARPDRHSGEGVYTTYASLQDWRGLREFADSHKGPIAGLYQRHVSERLYAYGLHRVAYAEDPKRHPELAGITSPSVGVDIVGRSRSGTSGTSELTEYSARLGGTFFANGLDRFDLNVSVMDLDAGPLARDTPFGKAPESGEQDYRYSPRTKYSGLFEARFRWEREGMLTPSVELGISPTGGELGATIIGAIGLRKVDDWGNWNAQLYREPVRDSILSYTGLRDPYTGASWGRVTETGGRFSIYTQMADQWSFYGAASAGMRTGRHVPDNPHISLSLAVNKSIQLDPFEFFVVGPSLAMEFYGKNLSGFTYGHGGYFSPSHLIQGMISARFQTHQGRNYLARGSLGFGIQNNRQESVPWFPNNPGTRWITGQSTTGAALLANLEALYQLSDQWVLGGALGFNLAPDYNDFSLRVSLRYFFDPRSGLFAQDFSTY